MLTSFRRIFHACLSECENNIIAVWSSVDLTFNNLEEYFSNSYIQDFMTVNSGVGRLVLPVLFFFPGVVKFFFLTL